MNVNDIEAKRIKITFVDGSVYVFNDVTMTEKIDEGLFALTERGSDRLYSFSRDKVILMEVDGFKTVKKGSYYGNNWI